MDDNDDDETTTSMTTKVTTIGKTMKMILASKMTIMEGNNNDNADRGDCDSDDEGARGGVDHAVVRLH